MKELDLVLARYLDQSWPATTTLERAVFEELLDLPDPLLAAYLLGNESPPPSLTALVDRLRAG